MTRYRPTEIEINREFISYFRSDQPQIPRIQELLDGKADINWPDKDGSCALHLYVQKEDIDLDVLKYLIENKADMNETNTHGTIIHNLCRNSHPHPEALRYLLDQKCAINKQNSLHLHELDYACCKKNQSPEVIRLLVENKADINHPSVSGLPLHSALSCGMGVDAIKVLLEAKSQLNLNEYSMALHNACANKEPDVSVIKLLIEHGAAPDLHTKDYRHQPPFHLLAKTAVLTPERVQVMLQIKADPNFLDKDGYTPFFLACSNPSVTPEVIKCFVEGKSTVNLVGSKSALTGAFLNKKVSGELLRCLLENKASLNHKVVYEYLPLHMALKSSCVSLELVQLFFDNGTHLNTKCHDKTLLHLACRNEKCPLEVIEFLVENKADVNLFNEYNETPACVCAFNENLDALRYLIEQKARLDFGENMTTPLHALCESQEPKMDMLKLLIESKSDLNRRDDRKGDTPLAFLCTYHAPLDLIGYMIANKADTNAPNKQKETPLHRACVRFGQNSPPELLALLIENNADINAQDQSHLSPFHLICSKRYMPAGVILHMIDNKADVNLRGERGLSPLDLLLDNRYYESDCGVIRMLLEAKADPNQNTIDGISQYFPFELQYMLVAYGADPFRQNIQNFNFIFHDSEKAIQLRRDVEEGKLWRREYHCLFPEQVRRQILMVMMCNKAMERALKIPKPLLFLIFQLFTFSQASQKWANK